MLVKRAACVEEAGGVTAVLLSVVFGRATHEKVEEKDSEVEAGPSELTALSHGPRGV